PLAELLLFAADRAQHVNFLIKPALADGKVVLSDRYADATFAYQGAGRGFSEETVNEVIRLATDNLKPNLTLFFDVPVEKAIARTKARSDEETQKNRMDSETLDFYEKVREAYLSIAENEPQRFIVVDGDLPIDEVKAIALKVITDFLNN
ncbi:MAG TPA: dTMP kinase, partial [Pyrinomonadaceae bacterium]|nr:dTMP kinase [Pyrinomonadaceae bacterium]